MGQGFHGVGGGILGLRRLLREHSGAFEFDLLSRGYRATRRGIVSVACPDWPLDWHEMYVLAVGFASDERCHLHRDINPDWEWNLSATYQALSLRALMGANWQRGGGQGDAPDIILPADFRPGPASESGGGSTVDRGAVAVESAEDLAAASNAMEERRAALRAKRSAQATTEDR